ncbi:MAG TPA: ATP-binding cassette domain-containing protein [Acidimicrobiales bacterium]
MSEKRETIVELVDVGKTFTVAVRKGWLRRERRPVHAVDGVTLSIEPGSMVGYIGPNGAGKSTTIKMLTGILVPSSGTIRVAGLDPSRDRVTLARRLGVLFGQRTQLWWDLPLEDSFSLLHHVYRVPDDRFKENLGTFRELLALDELLPVPVRQLSLGQRMRGELAAVLLHDPAILFLDEPTIGLDPVSKEAVRSFLVELNATRRTTVMLTTHDLVDVERLCERLVIIDHGRVIEDSTVAAIKHRYGTVRTLIVDLEQPSEPLCIEGACVVRVDGPRQWLQFRRDDLTAAALLERVAAQAPVRDLSVEEPAIEDIVRAIYRGEAV